MAVPGSQASAGGLIVTYAMTSRTVHLPLLSAVVGELHPWQMALVLVGLPGFVVSAIALSIREPQRRGARWPGAALAPPALLLGYLRENFRVYAALMLGAALTALCSYGAFSWIPTLFMRRWSWSAAQIGGWFGLATFLFGTLGMLGSG
jgi:hypothetical protein